MSVIGLDIGFYSVKLLQMEKKGQEYRVLRLASEEVQQDGKGFDPEKVKGPLLAAAIGSACRKVKLKPRRLKKNVTAISGTNVTVKQIQTVEMSEEELESSLRFEARKHIPMDRTDANLDFFILGEDPRELDKINVLLVASTRRTATEHVELLQEVGINPWIVDAVPIALTNAFLKTEEMPEEGAIVLLNIGAITSTLVVWGRKDQFFTREIPIAGHHFTQAYMEDQRNYAEAERLKQTQGVTYFQQKKETSATTLSLELAEKSIYDHFVEELRRSLRFYIKKTNQSYFHKILITGGSSLVPGLVDFITSSLNVPCELFIPLKRFLSEQENEPKNLAAFTVALGLAIRGLEN